MTRLIKIANWSGKPRGHVIFVHGLGGHAYDTWRRRADDDSFWSVWLARDIKGLTVWTLDYAAPPINWLGNALPLHDRAITVLERLLSEPDLADAPVAFVCHSLGGLVVKQMLREANDQREHRVEAGALVDRVRAVVFIATPHTGSAHASWLDRLRLIVWPSTAIQDLIRNDPNLRSLNVWYRNWPNEIAHRIFYEAQGTTAGTIVDPGSADTGLPDVVPVAIEVDHIGICKPAGEDDLIYVGTRDFLATQVFKESRRGKRYSDLTTLDLPSVTRSRPNTWAPRVLRLAVLVVIGVVGFKGIEALLFPPDPLKDATVQQIEQVLHHKRPELTPEQINRFIQSLRKARGDPTFEKAVEEAKKGNPRIAEGIWRQIYEDRKRQKARAREEQAEAARNHAAAAIVESVADGLHWYREATTLDPQSMEGWLGLGDAASSAGITAEAERAFRQYLLLARKTGNDREEGVGYNRLGDALVAQGNLTAALESYQASLAIAERLVKADPGNAGWQRELSVSHEKIGDVLVAQGNLTAALESYQASLAIAERLAKADPGNAGWQRDLAWSHWRLAQYGNKPRFHWQEVVRILRKLDEDARLAPSDQKWLPIAEENLGTTD